jgi:hypothetical protein
MMHGGMTFLTDHTAINKTGLFFVVSSNQFE